MPDPSQELEFILSLDMEPLKQGLSQAEQLMQQGVERMNALNQGQQTTVVSSPAGTAPPLPPIVPPPPQPLPAPPQPSTPQPFPGTQPHISSAWEELEKIKAQAKIAPDVAMAGLVGMGGGGLRSRAVRGSMAEPEAAEEYQRLLVAIKDLTKEIQQTAKASESGQDPATGLLKFIRGNAMVGVAGNIASQAMGGNVLGAGGSAVGAGIGMMLGGPIGAQAGSAVGGMVGSSAGSFLSQADEAREYDKMSADIAARFGDFSQEKGLKVPELAKMNTSGYSTQETSQLFDQLRQTHVISSVDDSSKQLVESIQGLTRATGMNTDAIVTQYSSYKNLGGQADPNAYMGQIITGAVAAGMRGNVQEYGEILGSARMQLVSKTGSADTGDTGLKGIQGALTNLLVTGSSTSQLLRDNPMMASQVLGNFLSTGGSQQYSRDSIAMQMAGVERGRTDTAYLTPGQTIENAGVRAAHTTNQFLNNGGLQALGMNEEQLKEAVKADPNFLRNKLSADRSIQPNAEQGAALQNALNVQFKFQYGRMPTAQDTQMMTTLGTNMIQNDGKLDLRAPSGTGNGKTIADLITESQKTEGEKARDAENARHTQMIEFFNNFKGLLTNIDSATADIMKGVNTIVAPVNAIAGFLDPNKASTPAQQAQGSTFNLGGSEKTLDPNRFDIHLGATFHNDTLFGDNPAIGKQDPSLAFSKAPLFSKDAAFSKVESPSKDKPDLNKLLGIPMEHPLPIFNDTPTDGVLSRPGFDTFHFAHGDVVHASPSGFDGNGSGASGMNVSIVVNLQVPENADYESLRSAAKSGTRAATDEFLASLEHGRQSTNKTLRKSKY